MYKNKPRPTSTYVWRVHMEGSMMFIDIYMYLYRDIHRLPSKMCLVFKSSDFCCWQLFLVNYIVNMRLSHYVNRAELIELHFFPWRRRFLGIFISEDVTFEWEHVALVLSNGHRRRSCRKQWVGTWDGPISIFFWYSCYWLMIHFHGAIWLRHPCSLSLDRTCLLSSCSS